MYTLLSWVSLAARIHGAAYVGLGGEREKVFTTHGRNPASDIFLWPRSISLVFFSLCVLETEQVICCHALSLRPRLGGKTETTQLPVLEAPLHHKAEEKTL